MLRSWMNTAQQMRCAWIFLLLSLMMNSVHAEELGNALTTVPSSWRDDADLYDITFVDDEYGWAVGDYGTIWHTQNGGEIWRIQPSPVACQLSSLHFIDRQRGWAAGGVAVPLTQASRGVLLRTEDGGKTWQQTDGLLLPWISGIHFSDLRTGIAVGQTSSMYPSGAWTTSDGGRTWSPLSGVQGTHWVDHDFSRAAEQNSGLLMGHNGRVARVTKQRMLTVADKTDAWNRESFVAMVNPTTYFAGQDTPALTVDSGRTWRPTGTFLPNGIEKRMQIRAMSCFERSCWLAGAPGNRILFSHDHGHHWQAAVAPSTLPIERFYFSSDQQGWAVGARGKILITSDGGVSWKRQRGGMKRYAMLGIFAEERDIPWDLIAHASAVDEHRVHIVLLTTSRRDERRQLLLKCLQHAAMQVGATAEILTSAAIDSEVDLPAEQLIQRWQSRNPNAMDWLAERLTQIIRARRPDVVLTSERGGERSEKGSQRLASLLATDACEYAASDQAFAEQLRDFGLSVWNVSRAVKCVATQGQVNVLTSDRKTVAGASAEELAVEARNILSISEPKSAWTLRSLQESDRQTDIGTNPFVGLAVEYGSSARRPRPQNNGSFNSNRSLALALSRTNDSGLQRVEQIERLAGGDTRLAGNLLFEVANSESDRSERDLLLRQFVARHDTHPLMDAVLQRLVQHHTSLEQQWREYDEQIQNPAIVSVAISEEKSVSRSAVQLASATKNSFTANWKSALQLMQEIKLKRPTLYAEPEIAFPLAAVQRLEKPDGANALMKRLQRLPTPWNSHAQLELDLVGSPGDTRKTISTWSCKTIPVRPQLDGDLGDQIWQTAIFQELKPTKEMADLATSEPRTLVGVAKDEEYFYLAAFCPKRARVQYAPNRNKRPRDAELHSNDRLQIKLDINRDYCSWWSLTFDYRGWTQDALNDDSRWDPKYYVASKSDDHVWTVEAAIPLDELAPVEYRDSSYWAIGVERVVPEVQVERWNAADNGNNPLALQGVMHLE